VIDDIVDGDSGASAKERMLAFWRSEIDKGIDGGSSHPLTRELAFAVREFAIPKEHLSELMAGVMQDMAQKRYATFEDLLKYCYRVASIVGLTCLRIFDAEDTAEMRDAAINLGWAFQLTNILRDVAEDAACGRIYFPLEDMIKFGVTEEDILNKRFTSGFAGLMEFEWERANSFYGIALKNIGSKAAKKLLPALIMADIYFEILQRIRAAGYNVFAKRIRISNWKKLWFALKRFLV
jgi:phytoene synthase